MTLSLKRYSFTKKGLHAEKGVDALWKKEECVDNRHKINFKCPNVSFPEVQAYLVPCKLSM